MITCFLRSVFELVWEQSRYRRPNKPPFRAGRAASPLTVRKSVDGCGILPPPRLIFSSVGFFQISAMA